jgi:uncharacterized glyoxalase superfamily protein PhnB
MTDIQPELWVEKPREALAFYGAAFGATVLHLVGDGSSKSTIRGVFSLRDSDLHLGGGDH